MDLKSIEMNNEMARHVRKVLKSQYRIPIDDIDLVDMASVIFLMQMLRDYEFSQVIDDKIKNAKGS